MGIEFGMTSLAINDRIEFFRTFSGWLTSGSGQMSVLECLKNTCEAFSQEEYKTLRGKMEVIVNEVYSGEYTVSQALRVSKLGFTPQELSIIEAAERSNQLRAVVPSLVTALDVANKGKKTLVSSLTMPIIIGIMLIVMTLGVLIYMLPLVLGPVLERKPESLHDFPAILRWYWYASVWLRANYIIVIGAFLVPALIIIFRNTPLIKPYFNNFMFNFKPTRKLIIGFNAMMIVYFLPALLRSGMPSYLVIESLANIVKNEKLIGLLRMARQNHEAGMRMGHAMKVLPFRAAFANAIIAGEETGQIAERVEELQEPFRMELERAMKSSVAFMKFVVMVVLLPFFLLSAYTSLVGPIFALMEY